MTILIVELSPIERKAEGCLQMTFGLVVGQSLWNRRRFLAKTTFAGLLVSTLTALALPTRYESVARLMTSGEMGSNTLLIGLLQSRTLEDRLIERFELRKEYRDHTWEDARKDLESHWNISTEPKYGIITIRIRDRNPIRAAAMVQGCVEELNLLVTQLNTTTAHREMVFLGNRRAKVVQDLESAEQELSKFRSTHLIVDMEVQDKGMTVVPGEVQAKLIVDQEELKNGESMYDDTDLQNSTTPSTMGNQGNAMFSALITLQGRLSAEQVQMKSLKSVYADSSVQVRSTQAKVDQLQRELAKLIGKPKLTDSTVQNSKSLRPSIRQLPLLAAGYASLYRTVEMDIDLFGILTQKYELAKLAEARTSPSVEVLDSPNVPEKQSWPPRLRIIFLGSVCSFFVGAAWIVGAVCWAAVKMREHDWQSSFSKSWKQTPIQNERQ